MTVYTDSISEKTSGAGVNLNLKQLKNLRIENVTSLPTAGNAGRLVFNTTDSKLYYDDGTSWKSVGVAWYATTPSSPAQGMVSYDGSSLVLWDSSTASNAIIPDLMDELYEFNTINSVSLYGLLGFDKKIEYIQYQTVQTNFTDMDVWTDNITITMDASDYTGFFIRWTWGIYNWYVGMRLYDNTNGTQLYYKQHLYTDTHPTTDQVAISFPSGTVEYKIQYRDENSYSSGDWARTILAGFYK